MPLYHKGPFEITFTVPLICINYRIKDVKIILNIEKLTSLYKEKPTQTNFNLILMF